MCCHSSAWCSVLRVSLAVLSACGSASLALAQETAAPSTLFTADEPLRMSLEAPFSRVFRDRTNPDPDYQGGRLVYADASGAEVAIDLRVRVRGRSRAANCAFPPLLLNFPEEGVSATMFDGQNRLKLVTHCESGGVYEQYLWLEYLAYRVLNLVTDTSLRVRVVTATYYDSEREREIAIKPGLLIEDEARFAVRQGLAVVPDERIDRARYDQSALALMEMFEYFIGNTDWSALAPPAGGDCCHNVVPFARDDGTLVPVPYDFDSSGLVNKPGALPDERLPIRSVRQRLFRGPCRDLVEIEASFEPFLRHRAEITALFKGESRLSKQQAEGALRYIDEFYEVLANPERVQTAFRSDCPK
jgi:hypothetical protein